MLAEQAGHTVRVVDGDPRNLKITTPEDLTMAEHLTAGIGAAPALRIGNGYDLHRLVPGRPLILGGVTHSVRKRAARRIPTPTRSVTPSPTRFSAPPALATSAVTFRTPTRRGRTRTASSCCAARSAHRARRRATRSSTSTSSSSRSSRSSRRTSMRCARNLAGALGFDAPQVSVKGKTNEGVDSMGAASRLRSMRSRC